MKMASLLALIGTGLVMLYSIGHVIWGFLIPFLPDFLHYPWIMALVNFAMEAVKIIGLALMGAFFFAVWRKQE